jgi:hypothetical protein
MANVSSKRTPFPERRGQGPAAVISMQVEPGSLALARSSQEARDRRSGLRRMPEPWRVPGTVELT